MSVFNIALYIYMRKSTGPRIDPCSAQVDTYADWENVFSKLTKKDVFIRGSMYLIPKPT